MPREENEVIDIPLENNLTTTLTNQKLLETIIQLTDHLTPKQKLVFTLWDLEEMPPDEIRIITGMNSAKIKSNLYLARKYIREKSVNTNKAYESHRSII